MANEIVTDSHQALVWPFCVLIVYCGSMLTHPPSIFKDSSKLIIQRTIGGKGFLMNEKDIRKRKGKGENLSHRAHLVGLLMNKETPNAGQTFAGQLLYRRIAIFFVGG